MRERPAGNGTSTGTWAAALDPCTLTGFFMDLSLSALQQAVLEAEDGRLHTPHDFFLLHVAACGTVSGGFPRGAMKYVGLNNSPALRVDTRCHGAAGVNSSNFHAFIPVHILILSNTTGEMHSSKNHLWLPSNTEHNLSG